MSVSWRCGIYNIPNMIFASYCNTANYKSPFFYRPTIIPNMIPNMKGNIF